MKCSMNLAGRFSDTANKVLRRKFYASIVVSVFLCLCLAGCGSDAEIDKGGNKDIADTESIVTSTPAPDLQATEGLKYVLNPDKASYSVAEDNVEIDIPQGGGYEEYERYYPDELYDVYLLSKIVEWSEIERFTNDVFLKLSPYEMDQLPTIYYYIQGLSITKEEFIQANNEWKEFNEKHGTGQSTYTDKQIEIMFGNYDANTIKKELKLETAFFYNGTLYNIQEVIVMEDTKLNEIANNSELTEYLNKMRIGIDKNGPFSYLIEDIDEMLTVKLNPVSAR